MFEGSIIFLKDMYILDMFIKFVFQCSSTFFQLVKFPSKLLHNFHNFFSNIMSQIL